MSVKRQAYLLALAAGLSGCATTSEEANRSMQGMTRADVLACAGAPLTEAADGATQVMSYFQQRIVGGNSFQCSVSVLLRSGRVDRVSLSGAPGVCSRIIGGCVK